MKSARYILAASLLLLSGVLIGIQLASEEAEPPAPVPQPPAQEPGRPAASSPTPPPAIDIIFPDTDVNCGGLSQGDCTWPCEWGPSCPECMDIGCQPPESMRLNWENGTIQEISPDEHRQ